jgi:dsDNA-binding SOS-regulon protein
MGRHKKNATILKSENINDIYDEINAEVKIINDSVDNPLIPKKKKTDKKIDIKNISVNDDNKDTKKEKNDADEKNKMLEKINTIEQLGKKYIPNFKKKKEEIISDILNTTKIEKIQNIYLDNVYTKIFIDNIVYYRSNDGKLLNQLLKEAGRYTQKNNIFSYTIYNS